MKYPFFVEPGWPGAWEESESNPMLGNHRVVIELNLRQRRNQLDGFPAL